MKRHQIYIRLPDEVWEFLRAKAAERCATVTRQALDILIHYVNRRTKMAEKHTMADESPDLPVSKQEWERLEKLALGESYISADVRKLLESEPTEESPEELPEEQSEQSVEGLERLKRICQEIKERGR